jgi:hypothetical protein
MSHAYSEGNTIFSEKRDKNNVGNFHWLLKEEKRKGVGCEKTALYDAKAPFSILN